MERTDQEIEKDVRELVSQPQEKQLIQIWSVLNMLVDNLRLRDHINDHGCNKCFEFDGSICLKAHEIRRENDFRANVYHKLVNEVSEKVMSVGKSN